MKIVIATGNIGKVKEIKDYFKNASITLVPQSDFDIIDVDETGMTFFENALLKARHAAQHSQLPALADDSGLCIDALNGEPGIFSARYAGSTVNFAANIKKVLDKMKDVPTEDRTAHFHCAIAFVRSADDPSPFICEAKWEGFITQSPQGELGFGYDPIFYVQGENCTAAELPPEVKNKISHRAQALRQLVEHFDVQTLLTTK